MAPSPRTLLGRRASSLIGLLALAFTGLACVSAPSPDEWLAAGDAPFRTPEGTFAAFKTATAGDAPDLGYRCLSAEFRRQYGIGQLAFRELLDRFPYVKYLSRAEVLERKQIGEEQIEYLCEIEVLFKTTHVRIGFIREDFYDVFRGAEPVGGDLEPFEKLARPMDSPRGNPGLALWVPLPAGTAASEVTEVRAGREWKLNSLELVDSNALPAP